MHSTRPLKRLPQESTYHKQKRMKLVHEDIHDRALKALFDSVGESLSIPVLKAYRLYFEYVSALGYTSLKESEFGKRIAFLFPTSSKVRHMVKGVRTYHYNSLSYRGKENIYTPVLETIATLENIKEEALHDVLLGGVNSKWAFLIDNNGLDAVYGSNTAENDVYRVERQVKVKPDLTWIAKAGYNGIDVSLEINGVPRSLTTYHEFQSLLLQVGCIKWTSWDNQELNMQSKCKEGNTSALRNELKKTKERERYWRREAKSSKTLLRIAHDDNEDLIKICKDLESNGGMDFHDDPNMKTLWESQKKAIQCAHSTSSIRWDPAIIKVCLQLWHQSKKSYNDLRESGFLKLPSGRLLRYYKNANTTASGFSKDRIQWMKSEADANGLSEYGRTGAIIFDEMSIQEDIELKQRNGEYEIVGVTRLGKSAHEILALTRGGVKSDMATHMLQFMFLGNDGFRFPFAHFPTATITASQIFELFWDAVDYLQMYGFHVRLSISDGAGANRKFVLMHFKDEKAAEDQMFTTISPSSGKSLTFMMDPSHNFKKIRNGIEKSKADNNGPRQFVMNNNEILWDHLYAAYLYDLENNSLQTHRYLTDEHFHLTSSSKMRNYLADDVLGEDMLNLMRIYQRHLKNNHGKWEELNSTIEFLSTTCKLLKNFKHQAPYTFSFLENTGCIAWLKKWEEETVQRTDLTAKQRQKRFLSRETKFDLFSMKLGFEKFCSNMFNDFPGCGVVTARTNQDRLENFFCSARCQNGQNNNPSVLQYESGVNAILQMLPQTSNKANCSRPGYYKCAQTLVKKKEKSSLKAVKSAKPVLSLPRI